MAKSRNAGGRKSGFSVFVHIPLAVGEKPWCLEWPRAYAESPYCVLALTLEQPALIAFSAWEGLVERRLNTVVTAAKRGNKDPAKLVWELLKFQKNRERGTQHCQELAGHILADLNKRLRQNNIRLGRRRIRPRGRRFSAETLKTSDELERLRELSSLGQTAILTNGDSPPSDTDELRIHAIAAKQLGHEDTGLVDRSGRFAVVKKRDQRVRATAVIYPYLLLPCGDHRFCGTLVRIESPHGKWAELATPPLRQVDAARTPRFRYAAALPDGEDPPLPPPATVWRSSPRRGDANVD